MGTVFQLYKGKCLKTETKNYRPITMTCSLSRIIEKVLLSYMKPLLNSVISNNQHGFLEKRSTFTNLIQFYNHVICQLDDCQNIDIASFDMTKGFDK